jgi:hypothetical protein
VPTRVRIGSREFFLPSNEEALRLQSDVLDALNDGGGFVEFTDSGRTRVRALISSGIDVFLEEQPSPEDAETGTHGGSVVAPFETYDYLDWPEYGGLAD